ncbi:MAG: GYD family protein [Deltaproteobacteria bacterium RIFOXYD12_FULL_57_12]|nr:MAG: GYD family protein [Deltaproteobacteria bacterium RIFOXYD12_FULL_57_12]
MSTYVILGKFAVMLFGEPKEFKQLTDDAMVKVKAECPSIVWKYSFATLGHYDVVDVIEAPEPKVVEKATMLMRAYGYHSTEVLIATRWMDFVESL